MKKFIVAILALVMLLSVTAIASAANDTAKQFTIYNVPCVAIDDAEIYQHHGEDYVAEQSRNNRVKIKHEVSQSSAEMNNRIAVYREDTKKTMGTGWKPADGTYYYHTSNAIENGEFYTGAGRGNTDYATDYGLTSITIVGVIHAD